GADKNPKPCASPFAFDIAGCLQTSAGRPRPFADRRLPRAHRQWPRRHRTAEERDEVPALQLIELHSMPTSQTRIVRYRIAEDVCFWILHEAAKIVADVEDRTKAIMERLGAKAGTQNIDRILRLPGTINLPNEKRRREGRVECPTKLLAFNGASYPLDLFVPGTPDDGGHHARQEHQQSGQKDKLERIICDGESGEFKGDRSDAVWWVINEMLRRGYAQSFLRCLTAITKSRLMFTTSPTLEPMSNDRLPKPKKNPQRDRHHCLCNRAPNLSPISCHPTISLMG